jgi:NAD(P)-dependent dehydrogenase (short-subunit alcohol dehydrogenase family)
MTNVVVGAASGMGAEVARQLAPRGRLILADRDVENLEQVAGSLGGDVEAVACDVTSDEQVEALASGIGRLEALVVTAGVSGTMAPGRRIYQVNLMGTERVLRSVEPLIGPGAVAVCFASLSGHRIPESPELMAVLEDPLTEGFFERLHDAGVNPDNAPLAYSVSKRGVMRLVWRRAKPWGTLGARILSLSPGSTDTAMSRMQEQQTPIQAEIIKNSPLGRRARPEEVANVVSFLTSEGASFMSGSDVLVDGGMATTLPSTPGGARVS